MHNIKEKVQNLSVAELVSYSVAGIALLIGIVTLVVTIGKTGSYKDAVFNLESQKSQLSGKLSQGISKEIDDAEGAGDVLTDEQIAAGETGSVDTGDTEGEAAVDPNITGSAQQAGVAIAGVQNQFLMISVDPVGTTEGAMTSNMSKRDGLVPQMQKYLSEDSFYDAGSWYDPAYSFQNSNSPHFAWKFECPYSFKGSSLPVVWTCRHTRPGNEEDSIANAIVAYATGVYDTATNKFGAITVHMTEYGANHCVGYRDRLQQASPATNGQTSGTFVSGSDNAEPNEVTVTGSDSSGTGSISDNTIETDDNESNSGVDLWGDDEGTTVIENIENEQNEEQGTTGNTAEDLGLPPGFFS